MEGIVTDHNTVEIPLDMAAALREYILGLEECVEETRIVLEGHIEKLENRLKALGAK